MGVAPYFLYPSFTLNIGPDSFMFHNPSKNPTKNPINLEQNNKSTIIPCTLKLFCIFAFLYYCVMNHTTVDGSGIPNNHQGIWSPPKKTCRCFGPVSTGFRFPRGAPLHAFRRPRRIRLDSAEGPGGLGELPWKSAMPCLGVLGF